MRLRGLLLRAEQRKSNRNQLSVIRPIILIPCPSNDRLHFQPGSVLPHVVPSRPRDKWKRTMLNGPGDFYHAMSETRHDDHLCYWNWIYLIIEVQSPRKF